MQKPNTTVEIPNTNSRIGPKSIYNGTLRFKTSMSILGLVKGEIIGGELLVVYPDAKVEGDIVVDYLLVIGSVEGNINARKGVYFYESSIVRGSVLSAVIRMQSGVNFEGECNLIGEKDVDIFTLSRDSFRSTLYDQFVHELDAVIHSTKKKS